MPKEDLIAVPDMGAQAMENWGLITFQEYALLTDAGDRSGVNRRRVIAMTVAHELAHLWFGNQVTTESWDTIWLNEGYILLHCGMLSLTVHVQKGSPTILVISPPTTRTQT